MTHTKEELMEKYKKLPQDVQDAIFSEETAEILQKIGKENKLDIEKIGLLADEAGLLMLGITAPKNFVEQLAGRLGIEKESVRKIAKEVNEQIFAKVRESLKEIHGIGKEVEKTSDVAKTSEVSESLTSDVNGKATSKVEEVSETKIPPVIEPKPSTMEIGSQPIKEKEIFRSKPEIAEKELPESKPKPINTKYSGGVDPYREPVE